MRHNKLADYRKGKRAGESNNKRGNFINPADVVVVSRQLIATYTL